MGTNGEIQPIADANQHFTAVSNEDYTMIQTSADDSFGNQIPTMQAVHKMTALHGQVEDCVGGAVSQSALKSLDFYQAHADSMPVKELGAECCIVGHHPATPAHQDTAQKYWKNDGPSQQPA